MVERAPKRQKLTLRGVVLDDSLLTNYVEATDTPPPLPLDLGEARKAGFTGSPSHHSALCNGWAVVKRDCICSKGQLSKRVASGGGCVCRPKLVNRKGGDPRYPNGA